MKLIWEACGVWRTSERLSGAVRHPHSRWEKKRRQEGDDRGEEEWEHAGKKRVRK